MLIGKLSVHLVTIPNYSLIIAFSPIIGTALSPEKMATSYYANHNSVTSPYSLSARKSNSKYTLEEKSNVHGSNAATAATASSSSSSSSNSILSSAGAASLSHSSSTSSNLANHSSSASASSIPALVRRILEVAEKELFIDVRSEFYLLPIAMHALQSPQEWVHSPSSTSTGVETVEKQRPDLPWFRELVAQERSRFAKAPAENSPWIKIQDVSTIHKLQHTHRKKETTNKRNKRNKQRRKQKQKSKGRGAKNKSVCSNSASFV